MSDHSARPGTGFWLVENVRNTLVSPYRGSSDAINLDDVEGELVKLEEVQRSCC